MKGRSFWFCLNGETKDLGIFKNMAKIRTVSTWSLLALQLVVPTLALATHVPGHPLGGGGTDPAITDFCSLMDLISRITRYLLFTLIILAIVFVILAAFKYLTAGGDAEQVKAANHQILYAAVAIAVGLLATAVPRIVGFIIGGDAGDCLSL